MARKKERKAAACAPRRGRGQQRQRLIDASIAALHLYGPSRTTVEKVVAIAKMSPGIVRFYFDSKAAMLVASLQFLATEFEERVMVPVAKQKATPRMALHSLVDLYLDPDIASPRKVSVWYAFWGEASSRQEYHDICGQLDAGFAALVRELTAALIAETSQAHLDADAVALGFSGVLELLWQDIAFQTERDIDRAGARRRALAYLESLFPGCFTPTPAPARAGYRPNSDPDAAPSERALFTGDWTLVGHESQIPQPGDFLSAAVGAVHVLLVRGDSASVHALRNGCPASPHALVGVPCGRFDPAIECTRHRLTFGLDGRAKGPGTASLATLDLLSVGGFLLVRRPGVDGPSSSIHQSPTEP